MNILKNTNIPTLDGRFFHQNGLILAAFLIYTICGISFFLYNGLYEYANFVLYKLPYFAIFLMILSCKIVYHVLSNRVKRGYYLDWKNILPDLRKNWLNVNVVFTVLMPLFGISFIMSIFGSVKTLFPMVNPFYLDVPLMELDRAVHFGFTPWELTHAIFGSVFFTEVIDFMYQIWFFLVMVFTVWVVTNHKMGRFRTKFILSYIFIWSILGTFLAVLLPASGPCFYGDFVEGVNVYAPLMDRLHEISEAIKGDNGKIGLFSVLNQEVLWSYYTDDVIGLGSGITAMPSMHVSFAMLFFLSVRELNRKAGYVALLYLVFIQVGSVHLGWHFALDGYVSMLLTWVLWRFSGWLTGLRYGFKGVFAVLPNNFSTDPKKYEPTI